MARIAGVDIPREKRLEISLTYIFGIGRTTAAEDLRRDRHRPATPGSATSPTKRSTGSAPTSTQNLKVEGDLRREVAAGHQAQDRDRLLPGHPPPQGPARCTVSAPTPTPAPARARRRPSPARRRREEVMAKPKPGGRRPRKQRAQERHLRRRAHQELVQQHDRHRSPTRGQRPRLGVGRQRRLQGLPQVDAVRRPDGRRAGGPRGHGARRAQGRRHGEGPGLGPRDRHPLASRTPASRSPASRTSRRCRTTAAARRSGGGSDMARYTGPGLPALPPRADEAVPQGRQVRHDEVPDRAPALPAGRARPHPAPPAAPSTSLQLQEKQKARRIYGLLEKQFRNLYEEANRQPGRHRREPAAPARAAPRQRRVPRRLGRHPPPGPPVRQPRPRRRSTASGSTSRATGSARATSSRSRDKARDDDRRPPQHRHARPPASPPWLEAGDGGNQVTVRDLPAARAHRRARPRAAHRRALLQVIPPTTAPRKAHAMLVIQRPTVEAARRGRRQPSAVRRRPARARLRPHHRQLAAPHPAVVDPRRSRHAGALRRRPPRVRHHRRRHRGRHRHHPEPQGPRAHVHVRRAGHAAPRRPRPGRRHRRRHPAAADVEILNPDLHIATLNAKGRLAIDLTVERGRGYLSADRDRRSHAPSASSRSTRSSRRCAG